MRLRILKALAGHAAMRGEGGRNAKSRAGAQRAWPAGGAVACSCEFFASRCQAAGRHPAVGLFLKGGSWRPRSSKQPSNPGPEGDQSLGCSAQWGVGRLRQAVDGSATKNTRRERRALTQTRKRRLLARAAERGWRALSRRAKAAAVAAAAAT